MAQSMGYYLHAPGQRYERAFDRARRALASAADACARGTGQLPPVGEVLRGVLHLFRGEFLQVRVRAYVDPAWCAWNGGVVRRLAELVAEERRFELLPVLGDALEDAGCADADLLAHCRAGAPHPVSCWTVDLLLGEATALLRSPTARARAQGGAGEGHAGHRYELAAVQAHRILDCAAAEWAEGHPEQPPTERVLQGLLGLFVGEGLLRRPFGTGPT